MVGASRIRIWAGERAHQLDPLRLIALIREVAREPQQYYAGLLFALFNQVREVAFCGSDVAYAKTQLRKVQVRFVTVAIKLVPALRRGQGLTVKPVDHADARRLSGNLRIVAQFSGF